MSERPADGSVLPLISIKKYFPLRYCPQANSEFYFIDYNVIPEEDYVNYCPLDSTDFYNFENEPE